MTNLTKGDRFRCVHTDDEIEVKEDVDTFGMPVHEMDCISVEIEYVECGQTDRVPHDRFRGVVSYERVKA